MQIHVNNHKQHKIFDPWGLLSEKRRKFMDASRPGIFRYEIHPILSVKELFPHFSFHVAITKHLYMEQMTYRHNAYGIKEGK